MANRYTKAEDGFFGDESGDDNTNETDDTPTMNVIPNETSDWYIAMTHPTDVAAAFLKAPKTRRPHGPAFPRKSGRFNSSTTRPSTKPSRRSAPDSAKT